MFPGLHSGGHSSLLWSLRPRLLVSQTIHLLPLDLPNRSSCSNHPSPVPHCLLPFALDCQVTSGEALELLLSIQFSSPHWLYLFLQGGSALTMHVLLVISDPDSLRTQKGWQKKFLTKYSSPGRTFHLTQTGRGNIWIPSIPL